MDDETRYLVSAMGGLASLTLGGVFVAAGLVCLAIAEAAGRTFFPTYYALTLGFIGLVFWSRTAAHLSDGLFRSVYERLGWTPDREWHSELKVRVQNDEVPAFDGGEEVG
jgi:hypothetical protein